MKETGKYKKKSNAGRPKRVIDYETCEKLASIFCTQEEIATFLNISVSTLGHDKKFLQVHKKGLDIARMSLRRKQFKLADKSAAMCIFLGKNYLGQRDSHEIDIGENVQEYFDNIARKLEQSYSMPS